MTGSSHVWLESPHVRAGLDQLDQNLRQAVGREDEQLREIALCLLARGGKRLRPALLLLARGDTLPDNAAMLAATAVELLHLASLYHDDVMDRACLRRGATSVNGRWGNRAAALAGTYLFSRLARLLAPLGDTALRLVGEAASQLCIGQLREVEHAFNVDLTPAEHCEILRLKTATLFVLAARLGAMLGRHSKQHTKALETYSDHLGLAFQLYDDVLDIEGQTEALGKKVGNDLREGVYSLPVLKFLQRSPGALRPLLQKRHLTEADLREVLSRLRSSTVLQETLVEAQQEARHAEDAIAELNQDGIRRSLQAIARMAVNRDS